MAQVIRREKREGESGGVKGTIEEELYDVLYDVAA
nr:hypothetical protein [Paenibacillus mucilaginosus]